MIAEDEALFASRLCICAVKLDGSVVRLRDGATYHTNIHLQRLRISDFRLSPPLETPYLISTSEQTRKNTLD